MIRWSASAPTPEVINEAEGTELVLNFSVDGEIPEGGITVDLEGDTAEILQQFLAPDGDGRRANPCYPKRATCCISSILPLSPIVRALTMLRGASWMSLPWKMVTRRKTTPTLRPPVQASSATLASPSPSPPPALRCRLRMTSSRSLTRTFTYTLVEGEGYTVDADANSGTFTVIDGVVPATSPTVGVTATPTTLIESEQTVIEVTFTTEGENSTGRTGGATGRATSSHC